MFHYKLRFVQSTDYAILYNINHTTFWILYGVHLLLVCVIIIIIIIQTVDWCLYRILYSIVGVVLPVCFCRCLLLCSAVHQLASPRWTMYSCHFLHCPLPTTLHCGMWMCDSKTTCMYIFTHCVPYTCSTWIATLRKWSQGWRQVLPSLRNLWSSLTPVQKQQWLWSFPVRPRGIGLFQPKCPFWYGVESVVILHGKESSLTPQIFKKQLDRVLASTGPPDSYPPKLTINISPVDSTDTSSSKSWDLKVLGLNTELSFRLIFPSLSSTYVMAQLPTQPHVHIVVYDYTTVV